MIKHLDDKTYDKLTKLLRDIESPKGILVELLMRTGVRLEELTRIEVSDIDHTLSVVNVRRPAKGGQSRSVPISREFARRIDAILSSQGLGPHDKIVSILGSRGNGAAVKMSIRRGFKKLLNAIHFGLGHKFGPHALRHTFALRVMGADADIRLTQRLLGHRSIGSTTIYVDHLDDASKAESVRRAVG